MQQKVEILAPAGSEESLLAAIQSGADAVYLSGTKFGARKYASNFDNEAIKKWIQYCHERGVKVYVTLNTLLYNHEYEEALDFVEFLYQSNVDAIIMQDVGLIRKVRENYSHLEIHASTQLTANNYYDFKFLKELGISRVVASREMSLEEMREVKDQLDIEIEAFVHGALCISYSGQCLMSYSIGKRSGNRGECAQPCRKKYTLLKNGKNINDQEKAEYLLSPKDLNTIDAIDEIKASGIESLKIEGRMKSRDYVYTAVNAYKNNDGKDLKKVFNRDFTTGWIKNVDPKTVVQKDYPSARGELIGEVINCKKNQITIMLYDTLRLQDDIQIRRGDQTIGARVEYIKIHNEKLKAGSKGDVIQMNFKHKAIKGEKVYRTYDKTIEEQVQLSMRHEVQRIPICIKIVILENQPVKLTIWDNDGHHVDIESDATVQRASKTGMIEEKIIKQVSKLGGTPYYAEKVEVALGDALYFSMKDINDLRRKAVALLNEKRIKISSHTKEYSNLHFELNRYNWIEIDQSAYKKNKWVINYLDDFQYICHQYPEDIIIYNDIETYQEALEISKQEQVKIVLGLPRIIKQNDLKDIVEIVGDALKYGTLKGFMISSYGQLAMLDEIINTSQDIKNDMFQLYGYYSLNVISKSTYDFYKDLGLSGILLSPEAKQDDFKKQGHALLRYGRYPVMVSEFCIISQSEHTNRNCDLCKLNRYEIIDDRGEKYPIQKMYGCKMEILSSHIIDRKVGTWIILNVEENDEQKNIESIRIR